MPPEGNLDSIKRVHEELISRVNRAYGYVGTGRSPSSITRGDAVSIYSICRALRPGRVIETGVSDGVSTSIVLRAIQENRMGKLVSIDYPQMGMPQLYGLQPGWVIPAELRSGWELRLGRSQALLGPVLKQLHGIDLFLHDSEHSYSNMRREFETVVRYAHPGSVIAADDGFENDSLLDVAAECGASEDQVSFTRDGFGAFRVGNSKIVGSSLIE